MGNIPLLGPHLSVDTDRGSLRQQAEAAGVFGELKGFLCPAVSLLPPAVYRLSASSPWGRKRAGCAFDVWCSPISHPAPGRSWCGGPSHPALWWSPSHRFSYMPMVVLVPAPGHVGVRVTNVAPVCRHQLC